MSDLDLKLEDAAYNVGDIVKLIGGDSWKFIEKVEINSPHGYETFCYFLRDYGWVTQTQIGDIMDALPD